MIFIIGAIILSLSPNFATLVRIFMCTKSVLTNIKGHFMYRIRSNYGTWSNYGSPLILTANLFGPPHVVKTLSHDKSPFHDNLLTNETLNMCFPDTNCYLTLLIQLGALHSHGQI